MPSAPAGGARSPRRSAQTRRVASASPGVRPWRRGIPRFSPTGRGGSAPVLRRRSAGANSPRRRTASASPGARHWSPPRRRRAAPRTGPGRAAKLLTGLLALQGALMGRRANTPYVGRRGTSIAVWPLGTSAPYYPPSKTYNVGALAKFPVIERVRLRRPLTCGRKACLAGQPNSRLYEPRTLRAWPHGTKPPRKMGNRAAVTLPVPVISAGDVLRLEAQGYQLPKKVIQQAHAGLPILGNAKPSNRALELLANRDPRMLPAIFEATRPIQSRFNVPVSNRLALPAPVQRKLAALEARTRTAAISTTAKALATPWKVAAKARNVTGRAAAAVGRGAAAVGRGVRYTASLPGEGGRRLMRVLTAQERKLPN